MEETEYVYCRQSLPHIKLCGSCLFCIKLCEPGDGEVLHRVTLHLLHNG